MNLDFLRDLEDALADAEKRLWSEATRGACVATVDELCTALGVTRAAILRLIAETRTQSSVRLHSSAIRQTH